MKAWLNHTLITVKLTLRDRQALFWSYLFPLFFLFVFASIFARGDPKAVARLLAGLLCMSAMAAGFFGLSIGLVTARERGILRRYRLAPVHPWLIISGEVMASFLVTLSSLIVQLVMAKAVYKVPIAGGLGPLLGMLSVGALAFLALGFIIASVAENTKVAHVMGNLLFFPLMFLGGAAVPLEFLPLTIQKIARLLPSSYMVDGLRRIIVNGEGLGGSLVNLAVLAATFAASLIIAAKLFRWESGEPLPLVKKASAAAIVVIFVVAALATGRKPEIVPRLIVIKGGRLIDGTGRPPIEDAVVIVAGEKIKAVFREGQEPIPSDAHVIDARGQTILPGLIDVHVHLGGSAAGGASPEEYTPTRELHDLKAYLYSGVTTIRSLGDWKDRLLDLRRQERAGQLLAPRLFIVGKSFTAPGGHPVSTIFAQVPRFIVENAVYQVETEEQARDSLRALAADQVDGIKVIYDGGSARRPLPKLKLHLLRLIIAEAHKAKLMVSVHCGSGQDVTDAVLAGADGVEHAGQEGLDEETLRRMAERGVFYAPTLAVYEALLHLAQGVNLVDDPLVRASVLPIILESLAKPHEGLAARLKADPHAAARLERQLETAKTNVRRAIAAGVKIVAGTDAGNPGTFHGPAIHRELVLLVEAGLTPMQALMAATHTAAAYLGALDRLGTIEPGKLADILIVEGDPTKDIATTRRIIRVIKGGQEIDRTSLFRETSAGKRLWSLSVSQKSSVIGSL